MAVLDAIQEATLTPIAAVDAAGRQTYVNPAFCRVFGFSPGELIGTCPPFPYWPPEERATIEEAFRAAMLGQTPAHGRELRFMRKNGERFSAQLLVAPLHDDTGTVVGWLSSIYDLTERKRAEDERQQLALAQAARTAAESDAARYAFLARAGEVLASSLDYSATLDAVARLAVPYFADICVVDLIQNGAVRRVSTAATSNRQERLLVELAAAYPPDARSPSLAARALRERTSIFVPDMRSDEVRSISVDERHAEMLARVGVRSAIAIPLIVNDEPLGTITLATAESGRRYDEQAFELAKELARRTALAIENARLYGEAQRLQRVAEEARSEAERASRVKDDFLAMLGHELRNPLAPILTVLELMESRAEGKLTKERAVIERQVQHLVRLVDDLLDVSRITRGKIDLKRRPLDLPNVVRHAIEMVSPLLEQRRHTLVVDVPPRPVPVVGDEARLAQVVANLLSNAAKYTPPGGRIAIATLVDGNEAIVRVNDNGCGVAPELLPHVFDLFTQGARTIDRSEGGLGLGLTIARTLIQLHGGSIAAASEGVGKGTEVTIRLPLAAVVSRTRPPGSPRTGVIDVPPGGRILVVDDNRDAADALADALGGVGFDTRIAYDGPSALEAVRKFTPDVALLDIGLPVMDGYELARRLKEIPGLDGVNLVAVTGYGQDSDRRRSADAGFREHLVKPVDLGRVMRVVTELISELRA